MQIGVYGGSFNPPHVGHAMVAAWLLWTEQVDEVWLLPSHAHPFAKDLAPFPRRVELCRALARMIGPRVRVSTVEAELPPPSYTVNVLARLSADHPEHRFRLVLGADNLPDLPKWKDWERIAERWTPLVVGRQGWPGPEGTVAFPDVSSTEVRRRIQAGEPITHLVPGPVRELLQGLYDAPQDGS